MASVAVVATTTLVSSGANAADNFFGPYNIDGTVPDTEPAPPPPPTMQLLSDASGSSKELGPKNGSPTKITVIHTAATPMLEMTNPNAQVDLKNAWIDLKRQGNNDFLYFAWERDANTGSGFIAFEFMKNGLPTGCSYATSTDAELIANCNPWKSGTNPNVGRSAGDFLILWDQSGSSAVLSKRTWTQAGTNAPLVLSQPVGLPANQAVGIYSPDKTRGEASINLTAANLTTGTSCTTFANVIPSTVTGNSDTADYKDTILKAIKPLSTCGSNIVTTPKNSAGDPLNGSISIGTGGVATVGDTAVVSVTGGNGVPSGTVTFYLCKVAGAGVCAAGDTEVKIGDVTLSDADNSFPASAQAPLAYVSSAGRYCWRSSWSGDAAAGIPAASENALGECFVVTPVTPTLTTDASDSVTLGQSVSDTANLTGTAPRPTSPVISKTQPAAGAAAGGSITFRLYGPSDTGCGSLVYTSTAVPVSGNGNYVSPSYTPLATGTYHWKASYSGDSPNTNGDSENDTCNVAAEDVDVTDVPVSMATAQSWVPNDSATLTAPDGSGDLDGTATFTLYASSDCSPGTEVSSEPVDVSGASPQTVGTDNSDAVAAGDYSWGVSYDSDNTAQRDIPESCEETSSLTVDNGDPVSSP